MQLSPLSKMLVSSHIISVVLKSLVKPNWRFDNFLWRNLIIFSLEKCVKYFGKIIDNTNIGLFFVHLQIFISLFKYLFFISVLVILQSQRSSSSDAFYIRHERQPRTTSFDDRIIQSLRKCQETNHSSTGRYSQWNLANPRVLSLIGCVSPKL